MNTVTTMFAQPLGIFARLLLAAMFTAALAVSAATHAAPEGGFVAAGDWAPRDGGDVLPTWTAQLATDFPGCSGRMVAADVVVVVRVDGTVERMGFDEAWSRTHDEGFADDVWVVGSCA